MPSQEHVAQRPALASFIESKTSGTATTRVPPVPAPGPLTAAAPKSDPPLAIPAIPAIKTTRVPVPKPRDPEQDSFAPDPSMGRHDYQLGFIYTQEPAHKDALTALGLDETMRQLLHNNGIYTFRQIAMWTDAQSDAFAQRLGIGDRIRREKWPEQARALHAKLHGERL
jgi:large subunit ribosomal protein L21